MKTEKDVYFKSFELNLTDNTRHYFKIKNRLNSHVDYVGQHSVLFQCLEGIPRESYYLATKVGRYEKEVAKMFDFTVERTRRSINESLERLKLNYVDLLQVENLCKCVFIKKIVYNCFD